MNKKITKYLPGNVILKEHQQKGALVLGDCNSAVDLAVIKPNKIKTIISIGLEALPPKDKVSQEINHKFYDIHDNKQQKLSVQLLDQIVNLIQEGRKKGGVLVHCYAGVSRSSSFVIAYVMATYKLTFDQAREKVKKHRPCIRPGDGFLRHLQFYQKVLQKREEERLAALKEKEITNKREQKIEPIQSESVVPTEKVKRGVKGAVRSAEGISPQKVKSSLLDKSTMSNHNIQQKQQKQEDARSIDLKPVQKTQKVQKLPPIHRDKQIIGIESTSRYERTNSRVQMKRSIDKIQGKGQSFQHYSVRGIYGNNTKIM